MALEKKAREWVDSEVDKCYVPDCNLSYRQDLEKAYIIGAEENGVVWHDLRKNPDDLPESRIFNEVLNQEGNKVFWDNVNKCWNMFFNGNIVRANTPLYWCEIPKFEE